jgi:aspartate beta-hydroxylase
MLTEIIKENIKQAYQQGDLKTALLIAEDSLLKYPRDIWFHSLTGELLMRIVQTVDAVTTLHSVLKGNADAYSSRLVLAHLLDKNGEQKKAFKAYLYALKSANSFGFWLDNNSTPHWCRPLVIHAVNYAERYRKEVMNDWLDELNNRYGKSELVRVDAGIRMYSGAIPLDIEDKRQNPNFLYIPGLPVRPVFDRSELPFADYYEEHYPIILGELDAMLAEKTDIPAYAEHMQGNALTAGGNWDALFFFRHGKKYDENHQLCPATSEILAKLPLVHIADHSPEACFSVLRPHAHILPHRGVTNSRCVLHMGLKIPQHCRLNLCGIGELEWQSGKIFLFDDTYLHEAWNRSAESRYVLLADVWNPFLSEAEIAAVTDFVEMVGELNN